MEIQSIHCNTIFCQNGDLSAPKWFLTNPVNNITGVKLKNFSIPLSVYLFDSRNSKFAFVESTSSGTTRIGSITPGNYNGTTLATELTTQLNVNGTFTYTVSWNQNNNTLSITSSGGTVKFVATQNDAYHELGLNNLLNNSLATTNTGILNLIGVQQIHIVSNVGGCDIVGSSFKTLGVLMISQKALDLSTTEDFSSDYLDSNCNDLTEISIGLYDDRFRKITPQTDYSFTLNFIIDKLN